MCLNDEVTNSSANEKVEKGAKTNMATEMLMTMLNEMKVNEHDKQQGTQTMGSIIESGKTIPEINSKTIIGKIFEETKDFRFDGNCDLTIKGCTFEKDMQCIFDGGAVKFVGCTFRGELYLQCYGKVDVKIDQNFVVGKQSIILHDESTVQLKDNLFYGLFDFLGKNKMALNIDGCQFFEDSEMKCLDDTVLKCVKSIYYDLSYFDIRGLANVDVGRCCFEGTKRIKIHNDGNIAIEESDFYNKASLEVSRKADTKIKRCYFNETNIIYQDDVTLACESVHFRKEMRLKAFGVADAAVEKCMFDKAVKFSFRDETFMKLVKNECNQDITIEHCAKFNSIEEMNVYGGEKKLISHDE